MKKYILFLGLIVLGLSSCKKSDDSAVTQAATDEAVIKAYLVSHPAITATKDASGLYYQIVTPGNATPHPTGTSNITVGYTSTLTDDTVVDTQSSFYFIGLNTLIQAWQIGLPKIGAGGTIILLVPSALGYGTTAHGNIPANTVTIFKITLQGFNG